MANITIDNLPPAVGLDGSERIPIAKKAGANFTSNYTTAGDIAALASTGAFSLDTSSGHTVDTEEQFRIIMLSNGQLFAIPYNAVPPVTPTGLTATVRLTSVNLTWTGGGGATSYVILRDEQQIGTTTSVGFRDTNIIIGNTYSYTVSSVDQYQQRSPPSSPASAFIDPSLNAAPTDVTITCWPTPIPTDGPAFVRVNAREIDVQTIAFTLGVDAGSLTATADPSVWTLRV